MVCGRDLELVYSGTVLSRGSTPVIPILSTLNLNPNSMTPSAFEKSENENSRNFHALMKLLVCTINHFAESWVNIVEKKKTPYRLWTPAAFGRLSFVVLSGGTGKDRDGTPDGAPARACPG